MKKIIKRLLPSLIILLLVVSLVGNWFLLNRNIHLNKKVDTLNEKLEVYNEDYNKCESDLDETMETLQKVTDELKALKKN